MSADSAALRREQAAMRDHLTDLASARLRQAQRRGDPIAVARERAELDRLRDLGVRASLAQAMAVRSEIRSYIVECLAAGIPVREIASPLGLLAEAREAFGPSSTLASIAGSEWLAQVTGQ